MSSSGSGRPTRRRWFALRGEVHIFWVTDGLGSKQRGLSSGHALQRVRFSYYDVDMSSGETINGVPVTEEQIAAWVAEAESGYDVDALKRRGRGRPGRGAEPAQVVALRLTTDELAALDARAAREHKSRSELIREAIAARAA